MKKNKTTQRSPADFKNNPFKSLKGVAPKQAPRDKTTPAPVRNRHDGAYEDEASLFMRAVEGVRKIGRDPSSLRAGQMVEKKTDINQDKDEQLFLQAMQKIGTTFRDKTPDAEDEGPERRLPTSRMRQLKRGAIRIGQELDLHGFLKDEAIARLGRFIASAFSRGQTAVLVITGKGINSPEGPVLRGAVAEWLQQKGMGMVAEFSRAPSNLGGSGAFVVFLKRK